MSGRSAIVFGGGGFIGTNLCRRLAASGYGVRAFGRRRLFPDALSDVEWREGDFSDAGAVARTLEPGAIVYHLVHATLPHVVGVGGADAALHIAPTMALLDACKAARVVRVVFVSSGGTVYGAAREIPTPETAPLAPVTPYAAANVAIERSLAQARDNTGLEYRVLRVTNPYGPFQTANRNQGVIAALIARTLRGERIEIWGDGSVVRDFIYINDVVDALIKAGDDQGAERVFNIGSARGRTLREVIAAVGTALGRAPDIAWKPGRPFDVPVSVVAIDRARKALGWEPATDFETGLRATVAWWRRDPAMR